MNAADMKKKQAEGQASKDFTSESTAFDTFDRMVEKIENKEAELEARQELYGDGPTDADLQALEKEIKSNSADDELEALKAKMAAESGGAAPPPKPAAPAADDDKASAIEDELAALRKKLDGDG